MLITFTEKTKFEIYDDQGTLRGLTVFKDQDGKCIYVDAPPSGALYQYAKEDEKITVTFFGEDGRTYQFDSKIIGKQLTDYGILGIEKNNNIIEVQRRKSYRVPMELGVECVPAGRYDSFAKKELESLSLMRKTYAKQKNQCIITDLSAEGAGILIRNDQIKLYDKLVLIIPVKEKYIIAVGNVVKVAPAVVKYSKQQRVGLKFYAGSKKYADRIYEFVFDIMRRDALKAKVEEQAQRDLRSKSLEENDEN